MTIQFNAAGSRPMKPVAIVDIGSNSVRLVAYEALTRAPTPFFNEKVLCGLGKGVATTGLLAEEAMRKALAALRNFRALCRNMGIEDIRVLATAATRDARNGASFLDQAKEAIGTEVTLIEGQREAALSAYGVASSFHLPDGVVGDLGGGSLELIELRPGKMGHGVSLPLGGLALADLSQGSFSKAAKIVREALKPAEPLAQLRGRTFYAVGGTWRALARLHMIQRNYPLHVMHGYAMPAAEAGEFAALVERVDADQLASIGAISAARRPLLPFGAVVLDEVIRLGRPKQIAISASGVREGLLFERLDESVRDEDPLLAAARDLNAIRSRDPQHGDDLRRWTDTFLTDLDGVEIPGERRLRHAACLLADTAWRAHPDYRATYALDVLGYAAFVGLNHPERAFIALAVSYRHMSADEDTPSPLRSLVSPRMLDRARVLALTMRVAYLVSGAMSGVLPRSTLRAHKSKVVLTLAETDRDLASDRVASRLKQLGRLLSRDAELRIGR